MEQDNIIIFQGNLEVITNPDINPGKQVPNKPNSYDSDEFGIFSVKEIGAKIRVLGGELPKHQGKEREYVFTEDTMERLSKLYGDTPEVKISLEKPAPAPEQLLRLRTMSTMRTIIQVRRQVSNLNDCNN